LRRARRRRVRFLAPRLRKDNNQDGDRGGCGDVSSTHSCILPRSLIAYSRKTPPKRGFSGQVAQSGLFAAPEPQSREARTQQGE
jgi:hypothetical protein